MKTTAILSILLCELCMALAVPDYGKPVVVCNRPNEHYECGSACQITCENLGIPCPIINIRCNDDCYCNEGYARNKQGVCIPISKCKKDC